MKKRILIGISLLVTSFSFAQQIGNSGFETWGAVSGGTEPTNWNSFLTASGGFSGQAANQLEQMTDVRPGSSGTSSVKVKSRTVNLIITTIVANGNLTIGKVNMGSATPSDLANHNYTVQGDADFSEALTAKPDSVVFWVKYSAASGSSEARMKATLHDDYNYKDPEDAASLTHIVATAVHEYGPTSGEWVRKSVPFVYSGPVQSNTYILITFTSNKSPGGGNGNDYVIIDDLELIYNQPLVANDDTYSGNLNSDIVCNVLSNDSDAENNINNTSVTIVTQPTNGSVVVSGTGVITYTPNLNYFGSDSYVYNVCDNGVQINCDDATVSITVNNLDASLDNLASNEIEIKVIENTIHFQGIENQSGTYYVYDLVGQLIQKGKIAPQVPFYQKSGVYLISVDAIAGKKTKRFFKN